MKKNKNVLQEQPRILLKILHHMQITNFHIHEADKNKARQRNTVLTQVATL